MDNNTYFKSTGKNQLTPITSTWMHQFMGNSELVEELVEKYGSPINVHHIPSFHKNIMEYQEVFENFEVNGQIYFARKANKSQILVKSAIEFGIGVDTASYRELEQAISLGGTNDNVVLTAAIKNEALMRLAIQNQIPIIIDNLDELQLANKVAGDLNQKATIGLRISGFQVGKQKLYSRFGFDIEQDVYNLKVWFSDSSTFKNLQLTGFHFHLDGYSIEERGEATIQSLTIVQQFRQMGHHIEFLDIGGGILMNYLESKAEWVTFQNNLKDAVLGKGEAITFNNNGLGFSLNDKYQLQGDLKTYPYYNEVNGAKFLSEVLSYKNENGQTVAELIKEANIQMRIEPGRSLLNQVGLTLGTVAHRKRDAKGNWLVGLEMNMSQLKSSSADFLLDPFVIYRSETEENESAEVYFTGAYCLEQDVLLKRKLVFPRLPSRGDYVAFVNTAGYMMHFYETEAHLFELSQNLYINREAENLEVEHIHNDSNLIREKETVDMKEN
ncbi:Y4yA family PLP-dependent enzyme [Kriegella aquimaris]|uniref:Diaminopimelate decarboxylase n=1 Tax=Kriegella aquimaris TaxID=192904 RepID=A0A1G9VB85_9FLAO|nr:Y4yA family PLP-dependent enzyme [Kriegella aquimaris]SDM69498.1 diaminopimelate decarboxylase [Kriegella aquimaris]